MEKRIEVAHLRPDQFEPAVAALVSAFEQDEVKIRLSPHLQGRKRMLRWLLGGVVRHCLTRGEVYCDAQASGAACWLPPGKENLNFLDTLRAWGMFPGTIGAMSLHSIWLSIEMQHITEKKHKALMPEPHWYLFLLGVSSGCQGRGIGGKLIEPVLERASRENISCYLETQTEANVAFYQRRGFEVMDQVHLPGINLPIWFMKREPGKFTHPRADL